MGEIAELIERLQKAEEGSRELDGLIEAWFLNADIPPGVTRWGVRSDGAVVRRGTMRGTVPHVTTSLDAAVALVERKLPGFRWTVGTHPGIRHLLDPTAPAWPCATVSKSYTRGPVSGYESVGEADAPTAPLALVCALLKALEKTDAN